MDSDVAAASSSRHSDRVSRDNRDRGSRSSRSNKPETKPSGLDVKMEPVDMEIDLEIDDLPPGNICNLRNISTLSIIYLKYDIFMYL